MEHLYGTYRGFFPTDESDFGLGEAQLVFGEEGIELTVATGLAVKVTKFATSELRYEVERVYDDIVDINIAYVVYVVTTPSPALDFTFGAGKEGIFGAIAHTLMGLTPFVRDMSDEQFERTSVILASQTIYPPDYLPRIALDGRAASPIHE